MAYGWLHRGQGHHLLPCANRIWASCLHLKAVKQNSILQIHSKGSAFCINLGHIIQLQDHHLYNNMLLWLSFFSPSTHIIRHGEFCSSSERKIILWKLSSTKNLVMQLLSFPASNCCIIIIFFNVCQLSFQLPIAISSSSSMFSNRVFQLQLLYLSCSSMFFNWAYQLPTAMPSYKYPKLQWKFSFSQAAKDKSNSTAPQRHINFCRFHVQRD